MRRKLFLLAVTSIFVATLSCTFESKNKKNKLSSGLNEKASLEQLHKSEIGEIVGKAIASAGGWEIYQKKKTFSFLKVIQHYDSNGIMLEEVKQLHQYSLHPSFRARITWTKDGHDLVIINNGEEAWKLVDGKRSLLKKDIDEAWNTTFGSHYMMFLPFKLADPGAILADGGIDTLRGGQIVQTINVTYEPGAGSSAGQHTWDYYFKSDEERIIAHLLHHGSGWSYTEYESWQEVQGVTLSKKRFVFDSDSEGEFSFFSTIYINEEMKFDEPLADDLFSRP